jgi:hypothetical protein
MYDAAARRAGAQESSVPLLCTFRSTFIFQRCRSAFW